MTNNQEREAFNLWSLGPDIVMTAGEQVEFAWKVWQSALASRPTQPQGDVVERVAKAIFFSGKGEWSITPHHVCEKIREQAESWWSNPTNEDMRLSKELAFEAAKAALSAMPQMPSEDEAVEVMFKAILNTPSHPKATDELLARYEARNAYRAILKHMRGE